MFMDVYCMQNPPRMPDCQKTCTRDNSFLPCGLMLNMSFASGYYVFSLGVATCDDNEPCFLSCLG